MRRSMLMALMTAATCLFGIAKDASATVTFSLVWTSSSGTGIVGTNAIFPDPGDVLTLSLEMTTDQTLSCHAVSINFDTDALGNSLGNELNLFNPVGGAEWSGTSFGTTAMAGTYNPLTSGLGPPPAVESTGAAGGRINTFESGKSPSGPFLPTGTYTVGTARFVVTSNVAADGADLFVGLFNVDVDVVLNNLNDFIAPSGVVFGTASVSLVPEPGTAALVGLGLVGLVLARRRRQ